MKIQSVLVMLVVAGLCVGCGQKDVSPRIMCDWDGKVVPTPFTFDSFSKTLAAEHGSVESSGFAQLKTRSVVVDFTPRADGTVLAERVLARQSGMLMPPAVFFGLTSGVPPTVESRLQGPLGAVPTGTSGTGGALTAPVTNN